ncbi:MAG: CoA transferase [Alphaproteobacteria bacterium]|nr:CoA transferase [Alphaproteobacteria bacterium]MCB9927875.1 CoA transferase [Alphaproteobacteria bacterium]
MASEPQPMQPFRGLRVVDLSQGLAGPFCAMLLGHYGADVVKVEPPEGDWSRTLGAGQGDRTAAFATCNRGKRAITVDLKQAEGRAVILRLAQGSDVFLESNRQGVADRLGIGYEAIRAVAPDVVYGSITGFGQAGPYADRPATDAILQAFTGLMSRNRGPDGEPRRIGFPVPDYTTGLMAYQNVSTALYAKAVGQGGRHLDISLMRSMLFYQQHGLVQEAVEPGSSRAPVTQTPLPPTGTFQTADGPINISIVREKFFQALCRVLDRPALAEDPRFATLAARREHDALLHTLIADAMAGRGRDELCAALSAADVPHAPVHDYASVVRDAHVEATGTLAWLEDPGLGPLPLVNLPGTAPLVPGDPRGTAPDKGEHTDAVLAECGYDASAIRALRAANAVA